MTATANASAPLRVRRSALALSPVGEERRLAYSEMPQAAVHRQGVVPSREGATCRVGLGSSNAKIEVEDEG